MVEFHRYKLRYANGRFRTGFILRASGGYSDLMLWPELGEPSENEVLEQLLGKKPLGPVVHRAIAAAIKEGEFFRAGRSLLREPIENHSLMLNLNTREGLCSAVAYDIKAIRAQGFRTIKIKVDLSDVALAVKIFFQLHQWTGDEFLYRLDFNEQGTLETVSNFLSELPLRVLNRIDFLEDPIPFDLKSWRELRLRFGVDLALDRLLGDLSPVRIESLDKCIKDGVVQVLVVKPSYDIDLIHSLHPSIRYVVTSNLGHPIGYLHAASSVEKLGSDAEVHGCHSVSALSASDSAVTQFNSAFQVKQMTPWLTPSRHPGCGFPRSDLDRLSFLPSPLTEFHSESLTS